MKITERYWGLHVCLERRDKGMKEVTLPQLLSVENGKLPHRTWQECATHRGNSRVAKKRTFNSAKEEKVVNVCSKEE
jgi:response regulator of citrate/malate metabolism